MKTYDIERNNTGTYNRRCIDGSIHGCSSCKGYCDFKDHSGYLTEKMIAEKHCIEKGCDYFRAKTKAQRPVKRTSNVKDILSAASSALTVFEGLRVVRAKQTESGSWTLYYARSPTMTPEDSARASPHIAISISACPVSPATSIQPPDWYTERYRKLLHS